MIHGTVVRVLALLSVAVAILATVYGDRYLAHCATEDGGPIPCVWDGHTDGNGRGGGFTVTERP